MAGRVGCRFDEMNNLLSQGLNKQVVSSYSFCTLEFTLPAPAFSYQKEFIFGLPSRILDQGSSWPRFCVFVYLSLSLCILPI